MAENYGAAEIHYYIWVEDGVANVHEGSEWIETLGALQLGDTLRVERQASTMIYWIKGLISYTSSQTSDEALRAEGFIYNQGASIRGIEASFSSNIAEPPLASYFYTVRAGDTWPSVAALLYNTTNVIDELQSELGASLPQVGSELGALPLSLTDDESTISVASHYPLANGTTWVDIAQTLYGSAAAANELETTMAAAGYNLATSDRLLESDLPLSIAVTQ